ncbi:hypothetical protein GCM10023311_18630 [Flaviramulus aquimarinus]|uniref:Oxidase n=1 Tax=Flaviramulus aquimarinus TaxID=1170456 RepID=A0ABP9F5V8_9FLAO
MIRNTINQIFSRKKIQNILVFAIVPSFLFYSITILGFHTNGFKIIEIIRDPAQLSGASSFIGFLSNIGSWLWIASASICFFSITKMSSLLEKNQKELLTLTGIFSLFLAVDDFFMLHDRYINQNLCYLTYAILAVIILVKHYKLIIKIDGIAFLAAGSALALSILTDLIQSKIPFDYSHSQIIEEGFKFVGIATWLYFNINLASYNCNNAKAWF